MQSFIYELKKMLIYRRGIWYISIFLLFSFLWLVMMDQPQNMEMIQYQEEYSWYLQHVTGAYTQEKATYLEQEAQSIASAQITQKELLDLYYAGQISEEEFQSKYAKQEEIIKHQDGFEVLYDQYLYVCENKDNHYFLQTNGWSGLLNRTVFPFPLFLVLLLTVIPIFCSEYNYQMDGLIRTMQNGHRNVLHKILIALFTAAFLSMVESVLRFLFFSIKYGLPHGDYPIQSTPYFGGYSQTLSLMRGYWLISALRCFGCIIIAVLILLLSVLLKKYALAMLVTAASTILPYIGLAMTQIYRLPLPLTFFLATDFFAGSTYDSDPLTGEQVTIFKEVSLMELSVLTGIMLLCCIAALILIKKKTSNSWNKTQQRGCIRRGMTGSLCFVLLLSGCASPSEQQDFTGTYNSTKSYSSDVGDYEVLFDEEAQKYLLYNRTVDEVLDLDPSAFAENTNAGKIRSIFYRGQYIYYLQLRTESFIDRVGIYNSTAEIVSIVELNTETFEQQVVFEQIASSGRSVFGVEYQVDDKWNFLFEINGFFLNDNSIFFRSNSNIRKVDRKTNQVSIIDIPTDKNIAFDGRNIFYIDSFSILIKYDTQTAIHTPYQDIIAYNFFLTDQRIYFINRTDDNKIYTCDLDGSNIQKIMDVPAIYLTCDINTIYFTAKKDKLLYCMNIETGDIVQQ